MDTNHYPSLELCKKLTEIGFPKTYYIVNTQRGNFEISYGFFLKSNQYYYPSVMEMLDVIETPLHHRLSIDKMFDIDDGVWYKVSFYSSEHFNDLIRGFQGTLPNALAETILWLHENNYISFSK